MGAGSRLVAAQVMPEAIALNREWAASSEREPEEVALRMVHPECLAAVRYQSAGSRFGLKMTAFAGNYSRLAGQKRRM